MTGAAFSIVLSSIGVLPVIGGGWYWLQRFQRGRRLLGFTRSGTVDVVLTTSTVDTAIHGVPVDRPLTGYGQVRAVASCAGALVRLYPRKKRVAIHLSGYVRNRLNHDRVALGGPAKNEVAVTLLEDLVRDYDLLACTFDDEHDALEIVAHDGRDFRVPAFRPEIADGYPTTDYGLVVVTSRTGQGNRPVRSILCAGFTTYGTAAAADYLFTDLVRLSRPQLYRRLRILPFGRPAAFLIVVAARFSRGECTDVRPAFEVRLRRRR